jgi:hypothetical protein
MRAGTLDRIIIVQRASESVGAAGSVGKSWLTLGELRAELVNLAAVAEGAPYGTLETIGIMFRTHYVAGITTADRVVFNGEFFKITSVAEIGRRVGLELKVERQK